MLSNTTKSKITQFPLKKIHSLYIILKIVCKKAVLKEEICSKAGLPFNSTV